MKELKVKEKSVIRDANGTISLKLVMSRRFKNNEYTHVRLLGHVYFASIVSGIVWIDGICA